MLHVKTSVCIPFIYSEVGCFLFIYFYMSTLVGLFNTKVNLFVFASNYSFKLLMMINICKQLFDTNNLHIVISFKIFLFDTNNSKF